MSKKAKKVRAKKLHKNFILAKLDELAKKVQDKKRRLDGRLYILVAVKIRHITKYYAFEHFFDSFIYTDMTDVPLRCLTFPHYIDAMYDFEPPTEQTKDKKTVLRYLDVVRKIIVEEVRQEYDSNSKKLHKTPVFLYFRSSFMNFNLNDLNRKYNHLQTNYLEYHFKTMEKDEELYIEQCWKHNIAIDFNDYLKEGNV